MIGIMTLCGAAMLAGSTARRCSAAHHGSPAPIMS
jgi:hypothetical protein